MSAKSTNQYFFGEESNNVAAPLGPVRDVLPSFFGEEGGSQYDITPYKLPNNLAFSVALPAVTNIQVGNSKTMMVTVVGNDGDLSYKWYKNDTELSAESVDYLTIANATSNMNNDVYKVVATDTAGNSASSSTTLNIYAALAISTDLSDEIDVNSGSTLTLSATATGGVPPYSYNWQLSGNDTGITTQAFTVNNITSAYNGNDYRVIITDQEGNIVDSDTTTVNVIEPLTFSTDLETSYSTGSGATFTIGPVVATGGKTPYTYQWYREDSSNLFVAVDGATSASYTTPTLEASDDGAEFYVIVTDAQGSPVQSKTTTISVMT